MEKRKWEDNNSKNIPQRITWLLEHFGIGPKTLALLLRVSESTVRRWQKGIGARRADRLLTFQKLEEIKNEAETTFAKGRAFRWYHRPAFNLNYETPIDYMLKKQNGIEEICHLIGGIKWGIPS